ncbi:MAG: M28 family peptidase [Bacteroidia bacterium]|nr:M28 family peptidase [Bacteroidia bacterium]
MIKKAIASLLILLAITWSFSALMPSEPSSADVDLKSFSTARALVHLEQISKVPHSLGTEGHKDVRNYIIEQLEKLGLKTQIQEGFTLTGWGNLAKPKNIIARIEGSEPGKALLLLSHYDSSPHSSYGASDAGTGVVAILEGLRAFLSRDEQPKNDIIILITDGEELGLNGADLFVNKHEWADDVGLVLNFEARGSGGPSYMLVETNGGNKNLITSFIQANPSFPVANSLAYSIYKMLPNDTDLTIFREDGDIDGFNFAFIDDHFDYHTALDTYDRLDKESLEHQGDYLMSLLDYFSMENLTNLKSEDDHVYFNGPVVGLMSYPFSWIWPMLVLAFVIFGILIYFGFKTRRLNLTDVGRGAIPFFGSLISSALLAQLLFFVLSELLYPGYAEMLHGFTYNGYTYIATISLFSVGLCFWWYARFYKPGNTASLFVAPIFVWLIIGILMALNLKGGSFFIIPVYFALFSFFMLILQRKPNLIFMALLSFPLLLIMSPFIKMFPVGLGLGILFVSGLLIALYFGLLIPVVGFFKHKRRWSILITLVGFGFLIATHFQSDFNEERPLPNSLIYMLDADKNSAKWLTYDKRLDTWTREVVGEDPKEVTETSGPILSSKYGTGFSYERETELRPLVYPEIELYKDTIIGEMRKVSLYIASKRPVNRMDIYANSNLRFKEMTLNGVKVQKQDPTGWVFQNRDTDRLFSYFVSNNEPLELEILFPKDQSTTLELYESSNDLLTNRLFNISPRNKDMIPKPFILNDAIIIKKTIVVR